MHVAASGSKASEWLSMGERVQRLCELHGCCGFWEICHGRQRLGVSSPLCPSGSLFSRVRRGAQDASVHLR